MRALNNERIRNSRPSGYNLLLRYKCDVFKTFQAVVSYLPLAPHECDNLRVEALYAK